MPDQPDLPALSDDDLRETLDLMATAVASMSDRIDDLSAVADKQIKVATEARIAAFAARDQTNPKKYGDLLGQTLDSHLGATADAMTEIVRRLGVQTDKTIRALAKSEDDRSTAYRAVFEREQKADRLKSRLPWFGLGALVVALVLTVTLPRFLASNASTCAVLGASWTTTTTGVDACVFYQR
jgi:uncharacterized membrane protein|tara:strand:+ start:2072 stop:2620 length:549 start_codon:yes stop_codon:yes gene_type:complete